MTLVYFLRPIGMDGPVKIGSSYWPEGRLNNLISWSPFPLEIAARIYDAPYSQTLEHRFHARFRHLHSHREWFRADPELTACIEQVNAGTFDVETLPPPFTICTRWGERKPKAA